ncbi:hypothetical protein SCHIN_v1c00500 [Spiroplasma chinense]|uniref:HAD superfamily hydrolase n=1 Tax=Spiroplasma chinense TaxID=216932 RepID=A0A5B9Y2F0_9MOLU|nr:HAD family hydrolase [Spiroplasma chinense]QEH61248.1 hypothetical protein SCHIN_v1c00500 [Spiroplasma chinense]
MDKIIYIDIDGTILDKEKKLGDLTRDAIINVQKKDVKVVFATGRTFAEIKDLAKLLELDKNFNTAICCNGSYISSTDVFKPENIRTIPKEVSKDIADFLSSKNTKGYFIDYLDPKTYYSNLNIDKFSIEQGVLPKMKVKTIDNDFKWDNVVLIAFDSPKNELSSYEDFLESKSTEIDYICSKSSHRVNPLFMIGNKNTSKLVGIEYINKKFNIKDEDVYIFGDGVNDLEMIQKFKSNAFVPSNAPAYVKEISKNIIEPPENDGVGKKINQIFDL